MCCNSTEEEAYWNLIREQWRYEVLFLPSVDDDATAICPGWKTMKPPDSPFSEATHPELLKGTDFLLQMIWSSSKRVQTLSLFNCSSFRDKVFKTQIREWEFWESSMSGKNDLDNPMEPLKINSFRTWIL